MTQKVVFVIGASGNVGFATVKALSERHAATVDIRAGVREPEKAEKLRGLPGVTLLRAVMGQKEALVPLLVGVDSLYIVTPGSADRADRVAATAQAAKEAGVKFVLVVSVPTADRPETIFGKEFAEIEAVLPKLGVSYCILRLPMFMENYWIHRSTISGQSSVFTTTDPEKPVAVIAMSDAGVASAAILVDPSKHVSATYKLVSNIHTMNDMIRTLGDALGKELHCVRVPPLTFAASMPPQIEKRQLDGLLELVELVNSGSPLVAEGDVSVYRSITGEEPTSLEAWVKANASGFL